MASQDLYCNILVRLYLLPYLNCRLLTLSVDVKRQEKSRKEKTVYVYVVPHWQHILDKEKLKHSHHKEKMTT